MRASFLLLAAFLLPGALCAETPQELVAQIKAVGVDPEECYRVRDLHFSREDLSFYLSEGVLAFGKPVGGRIISAIFSADVDGGDAELLVRPPTRGERMSLSAFTQSPNMNEHFTAALFLFTDDTAEALHKALQAQSSTRSPEQGLLLAQAFNSVQQNLSGSFAVRLISDLLNSGTESNGLFYAAVQGKQLGNFDAFVDPNGADHIFLGQIRYKDNRSYYDTWTRFPARSFRNGQRKAAADPISLTDYRIQGELDADLHLKVVTQATLTPKQAGVRVLPFEITAGMKVNSLRVNGEEVEVFTRESFRADLMRGNESVMFLGLLKQPLEMGRAYQVEFEHDGDVVRAFGNDVYGVASRGNWYPRAGNNFAQFDMTFTYPSTLDMVFPGEVKEDRTQGETRTTRRVTGAPIRMAGFNLGHYQQSKTTRGPLTVEVFANKALEPGLIPRRRDPILLPTGPEIFPRPRIGAPPTLPRVEFPPVPLPPNPAARLDELASEVASAFEFLNTHLGPPALPRLMVAPIPGTFGQGFPGLVYLSTLAYLAESDRPASAQGQQNQTFFSDLLSAHETAHQWWGNVVTSAGIQDEWLMEALANYSSILLVEKKRGLKVANSVMNEYKARLLQKDDEGRTIDSAGPIRLGSRLQASVSPGSWSAIVYGKGTWILHMLRKRMGDENFLKLLGEVCRRYRYHTLSVQQFQELAASYLPKDASDAKLDNFFAHWVEGTGIPTLSLKTSVKGAAPNIKLTLTVTQTGIDKEASLMVPVEVQLTRTKSQTYWITTGPDPESMVIPLRAAPVKVTLDPSESVLRN